ISKRPGAAPERNDTVWNSVDSTRHVTVSPTFTLIAPGKKELTWSAMSGDSAPTASVCVRGGKMECVWCASSAYAGAEAITTTASDAARALRLVNFMQVLLWI